MRCYNHPEEHAVGSCKGCCKGLCRECAADLGHGLACRNQHEDMVESYNAIITRNARVQAAAPRGGLIMPAFLGFMGLVFVGSGLFTRGRPIGFGLVMGIGSIVFALLLFSYNRRVYGGPAMPDPSPQPTSGGSGG